MAKKLRILSCLCLVFFASAAATTTRAAEKWLRLSSEHFDMLSCTSERSSKQMLVELEQFRVCFLNTFPEICAYDPRPLIFVFDTDKQFTPYKPRTPDGKERPSQGLYMTGPFLPRMMLENRYLEQGLSTIFHEYTHSLVHARMGDNVPAWFNEGLAEVYETFEVSGDRVTFGQGSDYNPYILADERLIPLGTLFAVDGGSEYYNEQYQMNIFYAESWLLMHYAMCAEKNGVYNFNNMLRFMKESSLPGAVTSEVFAKVFGSDYDKLEEELDGYMHGGHVVGKIGVVPAKPIRDKITVRPATTEEREIELAGARWRSNGAADAVATLLDLPEKYPDNPRVYEILAEMKMSQGEYGEVTDYLRKAVGKKSTSPMVYIWLLRNYYTASDLPLGYIMPEDMAAEYTSLVDRALELAPDCMEAYEMLAIIESQRAHMRSEKLEEVLKALPDMNEPGKTYLAMATVCWRLKRYAEAEAALNTLLQDPKFPYWLKWRARELLSRIAKETGKPPPPSLPSPTKQNQIILKMPVTGP